MNQLTIALARFPFTNQIDYKIRPALIISNDGFNKVHAFYWTCPLTTKATLKEFELEMTEKDFSGELKAKSFVRTDTIASMEKELFLGEIGKVTPQFFEKVKKELMKNL